MLISYTAAACSRDRGGNNPDKRCHSAGAGQHACLQHHLLDARETESKQEWPMRGGAMACVEAYLTLDFFRTFCVKAERTKEK